MKRIARSGRRWLAFVIWLAGLFIFASLGWWNLAASRNDAENRLISEAGRTAAQIAGLLATPGAYTDHDAARAIVKAAMEDERIYAIQARMKHGVMEGLRRNYLWEPVPWDDEIAENCVQGMNPIRVGGQLEGRVDVWLSPRLNVEEGSLLEKREHLRLFLVGSLWTLAFVLLLWHWGEFRHFRNLMIAPAKSDAAKESKAEKIVLGLGRAGEPAVGVHVAKGPDAAQRLVDGRLGQEFQKNNRNAWLITAGMFRQTFARAPALMGRLYADGEMAGLCHLGRMLEQAAPCVGARPLAKAARAMQNALNDPDCKTRALPVEACAHVLEQTLAALGGKDLREAQAGAPGAGGTSVFDSAGPEPEKQEM